MARESGSCRNTGIVVLVSHEVKEKLGREKEGTSVEDILSCLCDIASLDGLDRRGRRCQLNVVWLA